MTTRTTPSRSKTTDPAEGCVALIIALVAIPLMIVLDGWALSLMWEWFVIVPTGWAAIGVWEAAGLIAIKPIVSYRRSAADQKVESEDGVLKSVLNHTTTGTLITMLSLGTGWILHLLAT